MKDQPHQQPTLAESARRRQHRGMRLLLVLGIAISCGLAIWMALDGNAVMALPLVVVVAALVRTLVRSLSGQQFRPADTPIEQDTEE